MDQHLQIFRGMPIWIVLFLLRKRTRSNCSNSDVKSFVSNSLPLTLILFIFLCGSSSSLRHCSGVRSEEEKLCSCASAVTKAAPELVIFLARGVHETSTPTPSTVEEKDGGWRPRGSSTSLPPPLLTCCMSRAVRLSITYVTRKAGKHFTSNILSLSTDPNSNKHHGN